MVSAVVPSEILAVESIVHITIDYDITHQKPRWGVRHQYAKKIYGNGDESNETIASCNEIHYGIHYKGCALATYRCID